MFDHPRDSGLPPSHPTPTGPLHIDLTNARGQEDLGSLLCDTSFKVCVCVITVQ